MSTTMPSGHAVSTNPALRVLVVDDLVDAAGAMARLLKLLDCDVRTAHDGHAAVEIAERFVPEIVLLDLGLPGIDGCEVARRLRSSSTTSHALIVALSGYGHAAACDEALQAGCDDHLLKPVGIDQLQATLNRRRQRVVA